MDRRLLGLVMALALAGCKAPTPTIDPFLGRQTVVPPRPGESLASLPAAAYYPTGPASPANTRSVTAPAPRFVPPTTQPFSRPPTTRASITAEPAPTPAVAPRPLRSASPDESAPGAAGASFVPPPPARANTAQTGTAIRFAPQVARQALTVPPPPTRFVPAPIVTDINQWRGASEDEVIPASHQVAAAGDESWNAVSRNVRASATSVVGGLRGQYGFDPDYSRLQGQLEFSQVTQRWKLRYIPLDGQTDDYGGSVVLLDTPLLDAYNPGDFVTLHGQVAGEGADSNAYSPLYRVQRIERGP